MENDAPVVGPDAPTANCEMVHLEVATADWSGPTSGLRGSRRIGRFGVFTSASPRCLDGGDVNLFHRQHRLEGTLGLTAASRERID